MNYTISNGILTLSVADRGAEMQSIQDTKGRERLWQGDEASWPDRALNLFPWVARLTDGIYTYGGTTYAMESHGFTAASVFQPCRVSDTELCFTLTDTPETLKKYPFHFVFKISYRLCESTITVSYQVENRDDKTMFFGIGGHPGFVVPMDDGAVFSDYALEFSEPCEPLQVGMSEDCFVTGADTPFALANGRRLPLMQNLFDNDAIILRNMAEQVSLVGPGENKITIAYPGFRYLGLWNWPTKDVDYVTIEPWMSLPARKGVIEALEEKADLISLAPAKTYECAFSITL